MEDDARALENRRIYERYSSAQRQYAANAAEDLEYVFNGHWSEDQVEKLAERGQMAPSVPVTYELVSLAVSLLTANRPGFQAIARTDDDAKAAKLRSDLITWAWEHSGGQMLAIRALWDFYVMGRGILHVYVDPNGDMGRGEVCFSTPHPLEVFPDPNSTHPLWDDAAHIVIRRLMTASNILQTWPVAGARAFHEGVRPSAVNDYAYGPTGKSMTRGQQLWPQTIAHQHSDEDETYEVIERQTRVRRPFTRLVDPTISKEEILNEQEAEARMRDRAYVLAMTDPVSGKPIERVMMQPKDVLQLAEHIEEFGEVWHLMQPEPEQVVAPDGSVQMQEVPPVPMSGPEQGEYGEVPGSTVQAQATTVGDLVQAEMVPAHRFLRTQIKVTASVGGTLLYEPFYLPTEHYTIIPLQNNHARTPYPVSDVRLVKDLQDEINKTKSLIIAHAANSTNIKVFVPRGGVNDMEKMRQDWAAAGTAIIEYDPAMSSLTGQSNGGIVFGNPIPLPSELYHNEDRARAAMERTLGIFALMGGDATNAPETVRGTLQIDENGYRRVKSKLDTVYGSFSRAGKVFLDLAGKVYTREKLIRLTQPDGKIVEHHLNVVRYDDYGYEIERFNDMTVGEYDCQIVGGSTLPSNRWALLEAYEQLYDRGIVDQQAVLTRAEIPDAAEILERAGQMRQMQQALAAAEEEIKKLQGDLQTAERETMHAKQAAEMERFNSNLKAAGTEVRKAVEVHGQVLKQEAQDFSTKLNAQLQIQKAQNGKTPTNR